MAGRGPQTFKKRQKEQQRKERRQEKMAKRLQGKAEKAESSPETEEEIPLLGPDDWQRIVQSELAAIDDPGPDTSE